MSACACRRGVASVVMPTSTMPRRGAAVLHAEVAGVELDVADEPRRQHRGPAEEVIEDGDLVALDVDPGVAGRRAADDEEAEAERRARDAGQALQHAQRIAERAGHARELGLRERVARHGLLGRRRAHLRLVRRAEAARDEALDVGGARGAHDVGRQIADAGIVSRVGDDHAQRDAGLRLDDEAAVLVRRRGQHGGRLVAVRQARHHGDLGVLDRVARALLAQAGHARRSCREAAGEAAARVAAAPRRAPAAAAAWARSAA